MKGKGTLESDGKAHTLTLHGRATALFQGQAELPKALTSGGACRLHPGNPRAGGSSCKN